MKIEYRKGIEKLKKQGVRSLVDKKRKNHICPSCGKVLPIKYEKILEKRGQVFKYEIKGLATANFHKHLIKCCLDDDQEAKVRDLYLKG
jgi:NMD protein affecting ribosome stability and mRNA decay